MPQTSCSVFRCTDETWGLSWTGTRRGLIPAVLATKGCTAAFRTELNWTSGCWNSWDGSSTMNFGESESRQQKTRWERVPVKSTCKCQITGVKCNTDATWVSQVSAGKITLFLGFYFSLSSLVPVSSHFYNWSLKDLTLLYFRSNPTLIFSSVALCTLQFMCMCVCVWGGGCGLYTSLGV